MRLTALIALACLSAGLAHAGDINAGRTKAATACAVCHGPNGMSMAPNAPHLAGQPAIYLVEQLKNYRSGKRPHEVMGVIARGLTDDDIADLAGWYNALRVEVKEPD